MLGRVQEHVGLRLEVLDADPTERGQHAAHQRVHLRIVARVVLDDRRAQPVVVALIRGLPGLAIS